MLTRLFSEHGSSSPISREKGEDETVPDRPGGFHADPLLAGHSMASISLVSTGRFSEIPLDVPGSEYQVLARLSLTEILVSEAPFLLLVFWIGIGALVTTLMNKL